MSNAREFDRLALDDKIDEIVQKIKNENGSLKIEGLPSTGKTALLENALQRINQELSNKKCCLIDINEIDGNNNFWKVIHHKLRDSNIINSCIALHSFSDLQKVADDLKLQKKELIMIFDNVDLLCTPDLHAIYGNAFFQNFKSYINNNYRIIISYSGNLWDLFVKNSLCNPGSESPFVYQISEKISLGPLTSEMSKKLIRNGIKTNFEEDIEFLFNIAGSFFPILKKLIAKWNELLKDGKDPKTFLGNLLSSRIEIQNYYNLKHCLECLSENEKVEVIRIAHADNVKYTSDYRGIVKELNGLSCINGKFLMHSLKQEYPRTESKSIDISSKPITFNWLHFSDFHWPAHEADLYWETILSALVQDLSRVRRISKIKAIDAIFFTGDLVKDGTKFNEAYEALSQLFHKINNLFSDSSPYFFIIPGNHDLIRPIEPYDAGALALLELWNNKNVNEAIWKKKVETSYYQAIDDAFKNFSQWLIEWASFPKPQWFKTGLLPGEFSAVIQKGDNKIGIVGLNSAFLQLKEGNYYKKLDMHISQLKALEINADWIRKNRINILLSHHSPDWLRDTGKREYFSEINQNFRFNFHFCGHEHEGTAVQLGQIGSPQNVLIIAPSLFGMKHFEEVDNSGNKTPKLRSHGYNLGSINFSNSKFRMWHRIARKDALDHSWKFGPAQLPAHLDDEGTKPFPI
jgi:hypothetical protein